jgi:hypothetical protein
MAQPGHARSLVHGRRVCGRPGSPDPLDADSRRVSAESSAAWAIVTAADPHAGRRQDPGPGHATDLASSRAYCADRSAPGARDAVVAPAARRHATVKPAARRHAAAGRSATSDPAGQRRSASPWYARPRRGSAPASAKTARPASDATTVSVCGRLYGWLADWRSAGRLDVGLAC